MCVTQPETSESAGAGSGGAAGSARALLGACAGGGAWGAQEPRAVSHGGFAEGVEVSQAWNETGGARLGRGGAGGSRSRFLQPVKKKISPQILKPPVV